MMEILLVLSATENKEFEVSYRSHPYYREISYVVNIVRQEWQTN